MSCAITPRLLIVPGLRNSGPAHWQTWLQTLHRGAVLVEQDEWDQPDIDRWADRVAATLAHAGRGPWLVVAHSFGCLAVARHLARHPDAAFANALLVAPADPDRFSVATQLPGTPLGVPSTLVASDSDPWMSVATSRLWARRWGSRWLSLGDAGHINAESGFGPFPRAQRWVLNASHAVARAQRPRTASILEWQFAL